MAELSYRGEDILSYYETKVEIKGDDFATGGRMKVTYASKREDADGTTIIYCDVEYVKSLYSGVSLKVQPSNRKPTYYVRRKYSRDPVVKSNPRNTHGKKTIGTVVDLQWVEKPSEQHE